MINEAFDLWKQGDIKMGAILQSIVNYDYIGMKDERDSCYSTLLKKYNSIPLGAMSVYNERVGEKFFPVTILEETKKSVIKLGEVLDDKNKMRRQMAEIRSFADWINKNEGYKLYRSIVTEDERNRLMEL